MKKILLFTILVSYLFADVGEITAIIGENKILRNNHIIPAKIGMELKVKDIIETKNGKIQITCKDNTALIIDKNTKIKISTYLFDNISNSKASFYLYNGIVKVLSGKITNFSEKRFKITTNNAKLYVNRNSIFIVKLFKNILKVGILNGYLIFEPLNKNQTHIIKKAQELIYNSKLKIPLKINKDFSEAQIYQRDSVPMNQLNSIQNTLATIEKSNNDITTENNPIESTTTSNDNTSNDNTSNDNTSNDNTSNDNTSNNNTSNNNTTNNNTSNNNTTNDNTTNDNTTNDNTTNDKSSSPANSSSM